MADHLNSHGKRFFLQPFQIVLSEVVDFRILAGYGRMIEGGVAEDKRRGGDVFVGGYYGAAEPRFRFEVSHYSG